MLINDASITGSLIVNASDSFQHIIVSGNIIPDTNSTRNLGSTDRYFKEIYVSTSSINFVDNGSVVAVLNAGTINAIQVTTASANSRLAAIENFTSSLNNTYTTDAELNASSSTLQLNIDTKLNSSSFNSFTASVSATNTFTSSATARLNALETTSASVDTLNTAQNSRLGSLETISASNINRISSLEANSASVNTLNTTQNSRLTSLEAKTGSLATTGSNTFVGTQVITGSLYVTTDLIVQGSSSLQNITASAVSIGTNLINLNTANPAIRFAGLVIGDSGSVGSSGSFFYDSVQDEMIFVHRGANSTVTSSVVLMGPQTYDSIGSETYLTNNRLVKGTGNEHIVDSSISDTGTQVSMFSNTLFISSSNRVGINTSTPSTALTVVGNIKAGYESATGMIIGLAPSGIPANDVNSYILWADAASFGGNNGDIIYIPRTSTDGMHRFYTGNGTPTEKLRITHGGLVGIGTNNPLYRLDVLGPTGTTSSMRISATYNGGNLGMLHLTSNGDEGGGITYEKSSGTAQRWKMGCGNNGALFIYNETAGTNTPFTLQTNGNISIGLGGGGAGSKLTIYEGDIRLYKNHLINNTATWTSNILFTDEVDRLGARIVGERTAWDGAPMGLGFDTGAIGTVTRRMTIYTGGGVVINASSVNQTLTTGDAGIARTNTYFGTGQVRIGGGSDHGSNTVLSVAPGIINFDRPGIGGGALKIDSNGNVGIGRTDPTFKLHVTEVGATIASGNAISTSTMKGLRIDNTNNSNESIGVWFNTGGSHWSGISGQRTGTGGVEGWATDLRFYTHETNTADLTYARERMRISADGYVTTPYIPAFKVGRSTSYGVGANSTIIFNDTSGNHFNNGGHYNTSTGIFTAPVAGKYVFSAVVIYQDMSAGQAMDDAFYIYKNSDLVAYSFRRAEYESGFTGNAGYYVDHANILLDMAAGHTASIRNHRALTVHGNTNYTYFYGYLVG